MAIKINENIKKLNRKWGEEFVSLYLSELQHTSKLCGYALAVHGSLSRDIDLLAVPWVDDCKPSNDLADLILVKLKELFGDVCFAGSVGAKPHGRKAYTIIINQTNIFIDLSIITPTPTQEAGEKR